METKTFTLKNSSFNYSFAGVEIEESIVLNLVSVDDDESIKFQVAKACYLNGKFFHNLFYDTFTSFRNALSVYESCVHDSEFDSKMSVNYQ